MQLRNTLGNKAYVAMIRVERSVHRQGVGGALTVLSAAPSAPPVNEQLYSSVAGRTKRAPQAWNLRMGFAEWGFIDGLQPGGSREGEVFFVKVVGRRYNDESATIRRLLDGRPASLAGHARAHSGGDVAGNGL